MTERILDDIALALNLAVFRPNEAGRLELVGRSPGWVSVLWPQVSNAGEVPLAELSPFVENFLVEADACWRSAGGTGHVNSGPWVEADGDGCEHRLQATALSAAGHAILLIEETGCADQEGTSLLQTAHEAALAYEKLQGAEHALARENLVLEQRVRERTAALSRANVMLREEIAARRRYAERLQCMRDLDKDILAGQSPEAVAEAALRRLHPLLPCEHASVVALDPASGRATVLASFREGDVASHECWRLSAGQLEAAQVLRSGEPHRTTGAPNHFGTHASAGETAWPLIVDLPLIAEDTLVGVLNLATRSPAAFTREHEEVAEAMAAQLAVGIRQARLFAEISAGRERLRSLSLRLVEVQETERRFLAHELHDEIGQLLTGLKLTLELSTQQAAASPPANLAEAIALVDELMNRVRQLSLDLRPLILDDLGLLPALDWLFKRYLKQTGINIQCRHASVNARCPAPLETAAFRIVQEALTNIARHARVRKATVRLWLNERHLGVQIEDQGVGFDAEQALAGHASSGITGMRERAVMLGGEFTLESKPGGGTRLTVELPLPADAAGKAGTGGGP